MPTSTQDHEVTPVPVTGSCEETSSAGRKHICVCIPSYKRPEPLKRLLTSLSCQNTAGRFTYSIVIVDNASSDDSRILAATHDNVIFHALERNVGFGAACNIGARVATTPYLFFLNPDARLGEGTLEALIAADLMQDGTNAFNPRIVDDAGHIFVRSPAKFSPLRSSFSKVAPTGDCALAVLSGSAIFLRRSLFAELGGFDENIFLYFEDDDLSIRLAEWDVGLRHVHGAVIRHSGGISTAPSRHLTHFKNYHWMQSSIYCARKHGMPASIPSLLLKSSLRWLLAAASLDKERSAKYAGRVSALWQEAMQT